MEEYMNTKNKVKLILDTVMSVLFITFFNKNLISFKFHIVSGLIFGLFIAIHIILNRKWIINVSKRLFDKKFKLRTKISYLLNVLLFVSVVLIIVSGMFIMKAPNYDRVMFWKMIHFGVSYLSLGLIGIHMGLYWNWIMNMLKKVFKVKINNKTNKIISSLLVVITLLFGAYTIYTQNYFGKTYSCLEYAVQHIKPQDIEGENSYYVEVEKPSFVNVVTTYGSIISVFSIATYYLDKRLKSNKLKQINENKSIA